MKHWLKYCRFSIVLLLALTVALSAAVRVSAVSNIRILGNAYNSTDWELIDMSGSNRVYANKFVLEISDNFESNKIYSWMIELQGQSTYFRAYSNIQDIFINDTQLNYLYPSTGQNIIDAELNSYFGNLYNRTILLLTVNTTGLELDGTLKYLYVRLETDTTSNGNAQVTVLNNKTYNSDPDSIIITNSINNKLDNISSSINNTISESADEIISSINNIDTNSIISILNNIYNYGSDYNQIDQTIINNLGSAEDQLSSAERALEDKSKSLMQQASAGISKATTASQTLVTSLTTTIPQIYTFASDIIEVTPPEVQAAVLAIPLLSFAVWLIGLRR